MRRKAIIISISGPKLTSKEKLLMSKEKPWGVILFKRNIINFKQTIRLTKSIRKIMKDKKYPILIDEEGGYITRLSSLIDNKFFPQKIFGTLYKKNKNFSYALYNNYIRTISKFLQKLGININTVPVLDLSHKYTHKIIGKRSISDKVDIVKKLGSFCIKSYKENKISTVVKHIPGHGRATCDSHLKLPKITTSLSKLNKSDFKCFENTNSHFAMTAHILFEKIDKKNVVTFSKKVISDLIRKKLKFKGILISDDISMKALKYDIVTNAKKSLEAGCNLTLYCAGNYNESLKLLKVIPFLDTFTQKKTSEFYEFLS